MFLGQQILDIRPNALGIEMNAACGTDGFEYESKMEEWVHHISGVICAFHISLSKTLNCITD